MIMEELNFDVGERGAPKMGMGRIRKVEKEN